MAGGRPGMVVAHQSRRGSSPRATEGHRLPYSKAPHREMWGFLVIGGQAGAAAVPIPKAVQYARIALNGAKCATDRRVAMRRLHKLLMVPVLGLGLAAVG